jgi:hypothetical protein
MVPGTAFACKPESDNHEIARRHDCHDLLVVATLTLLCATALTGAQPCLWRRC